MIDLKRVIHRWRLSILAKPHGINLGAINRSLVHLFMYQEFAMDLKVARRKSGLTQIDCAHLLGIHDTLLSQMENGRRMPTVKEICSLSLIYGRSFESLFSGVFQDVRIDLKERLLTIPKAPKAWIGSLNRQNTIDRLAQDLANNGGAEYGL